MNKACESGSRESREKFDKHTFSGRKLTYFMQTTPIFCVSTLLSLLWIRMDYRTQKNFFCLAWENALSFYLVPRELIKLFIIFSAFRTVGKFFKSFL